MTTPSAEQIATAIRNQADYDRSKRVTARLYRFQTELVIPLRQPAQPGQT